MIDLKLDKKVVLITGGSRGIGKAISKLFVDEGADVVITSKNQKKLQQTSKELGNLFFVAGDIKNENDVKKYTLYEKFSNIILFDSKGYEKSISFDHSLINNLRLNTKIMIAGNIKYNDKLDKFNKIADIIDISGGLETLGQKDISKNLSKTLDRLSISEYQDLRTLEMSEMDNLSNVFDRFF